MFIYVEIDLHAWEQVDIELQKIDMQLQTNVHTNILKEYGFVVFEYSAMDSLLYFQIKLTEKEY